MEPPAKRRKRCKPAAPARAAPARAAPARASGGAAASGAAPTGFAAIDALDAQLAQREDDRKALKRRNEELSEERIEKRKRFDEEHGEREHELRRRIARMKAELEGIEDKREQLRVKYCDQFRVFGLQRHST